VPIRRADALGFTEAAETVTGDQNAKAEWTDYGDIYLFCDYHLKS
jgi:hypothetical protein